MIDRFEMHEERILRTNYLYMRKLKLNPRINFNDPIFDSYKYIADKHKEFKSINE